jgi:hypothetical protein
MVPEYLLSSKTKRIGKGWLDCCPAHHDQTPSLSINLGSDGWMITIKAAPEGKVWNDVLMEERHDAV